MKKPTNPKIGKVCVHELKRGSYAASVVVCSHPELVKDTRYFCLNRKGETYITTLTTCAQCKFFELVMPLANKPITQSSMLRML